MEGKFSKLNQRDNKSSRRLEMGGVNDTSINIGGNVIRSTITTGTVYSKGEARNSTGVNIANDITDQSVSTADVSTTTSGEFRNNREEQSAKFIKTANGFVSYFKALADGELQTDISNSCIEKIENHLEVLSLDSILLKYLPTELSSLIDSYTSASANLFSLTQEFNRGEISKNDVLTGSLLKLSKDILASIKDTDQAVLQKYAIPPIKALITMLTSTAKSQPIESSPINRQPNTGKTEYSPITSTSGDNVKLTINGDGTYSYSRDGKSIDQDQAVQYGASIPIKLENGKYKIGTNIITAGRIIRRK